jgi:hypothetical protein
MTPKKTVTLDDDVRKQLEARVQAEGGDFDELANEAMRIGLEAKWQTLVKRGRCYSSEMREAPSDEDAIQIATDAVHESRADQQRSGR